MSLEQDIAAAVAAVDFGRATAAKRGRNPEWPYVPIVDYGEQEFGCHVTKTKQLLGLAFKTRAEAIEVAQAHIGRAREALAVDLAKPNKRALREHHGLPRDIS